MHILIIVIIVFAWNSCNAMETEVPKSETESGFRIFSNIVEIKQPVQMAVGDGRVVILVDGTMRSVKYDNKYKLSETFQSIPASNPQHIAATDLYQAYATDYDICASSDTANQAEFCETKAHNTQINGLYGFNIGNEVNYFISSSAYPNFKLWWITPENKIKELGQKRRRYLLAVGSDGSVLYAEPSWGRRRWFGWWFGNPELDIKYAEFSPSGFGDEKKLEKMMSQLNLTRSNIINYQFYYDGQFKSIYAYNKQTRVISKGSFYANRNEYNVIGKVPDNFKKILFVSEDSKKLMYDEICYLTTKTLKNVQTISEWQGEIPLTQYEEEVLDGIIKDNHLFYVTKNDTDIWLRVINIPDKIKESQEQKQEKISQTRIIPSGITVTTTRIEETPVQKIKDLFAYCKLLSKDFIKSPFITDITISSWITKNKDLNNLIKNAIQVNVTFDEMPLLYQKFVHDLGLPKPNEIKINIFSYTVFACPTKDVVKTLIDKGAKDWKSDISYLTLVKFIDYVDRFKYLGAPMDDDAIKEKHKEGVYKPWALDALKILQNNKIFTQDEMKNSQAQRIIEDLELLK